MEKDATKNHGIPDKPERSSRYRGPQLFRDIWFAFFPVWVTLMVGVAYIAWRDSPVPTITPATHGLATFLLFSAGLVAAFFTVMWCLWRVDKIDRGLNQVKWYVIVLILHPFGSTLCYFIHLRKHLDET